MSSSDRRRLLSNGLADLTLLRRQILFRSLLLIAVCIAALKINPRIQDIPYDKLLSHYKRPRQTSTFSLWTMGLLVIFEPVAIFWLLSENFRDAVDLVLMWSLSISVTALVIEVLKLAVGRPRPDFYYRCFPDGLPRTELQCMGKLRDIMDGRKSFPSGHTGLSFASLGMVSLFMYQRRIVLNDEPSRVSQLLCWAMPLMVATAIGVSRWLDHHHHWEDVLAGAFIGFSTSCICYNYNVYNSDHDRCEVDTCMICDRIISR